MLRALNTVFTDPAHLPAVHSVPIISGGEPNSWTEKLSKLSLHEWSVNWSPVEEKGETHRAVVELNHKMTIFHKWCLFNFKVNLVNKVSLICSSMNCTHSSSSLTLISFYNIGLCRSNWSQLSPPSFSKYWHHDSIHFAH